MSTQPVNVATKCTSMPENSTHKCTNAVNNVQPIRNLSHMAKVLSVCNRLQAGDCETRNGGKKRVSRLTQFIHAMLQVWLAHLAETQCALTGTVCRKSQGSIPWVGQ